MVIESFLTSALMKLATKVKQHYYSEMCHKTY